MVTDSHGLPLAAQVSPGQDHESRYLQPVLNAVRIPQPLGRPRQRPQRVAGDKGYSFPYIRAWLSQHRILPVIPQRSNESPVRQPFDKDTYRRRNVIERCVGWMKECRRIATRFEKLAVNFLGMIKLAMMARYLRIQLSDTA